jgi:hypothetical protein
MRFWACFARTGRGLTATGFLLGRARPGIGRVGAPAGQRWFTGFAALSGVRDVARARGLVWCVIPGF